MRMSLRAGAAVMALVAVASFGPTLPAAAQKLPWSDANPLERLFGKPAPRKHQNRSLQGKRSSSQKAKTPAKSPAVAAVPVPDKRPDKTGAMPATAAATATAAAATSDTRADAADSAAANKPVEAVTPAVPAPEAVPKPEPSPAAPTEPVEPAASKPAIDSDAAATAPAVEPAAPADPAATAAKPVDEIPVPDKRPPEPTDATPTVEPVAPVAPVAPPVAKEAVDVDPAPNSTDKLKSRVPIVSPAASVLAAAAIEDAESCEAELTKRGVEFTVEDSISEGECGVLRPIRVTKLASGVKVSPRTQMLCRAALALDDWMTKGVMPAAKADLPDRKLTEFRHASTYVCRPRASEKGISEHARGSAIDIAAFVFDKGEEIGVEAKPAGTPEAKFQDEIRAAACGPFKTVLGPGTDSDHSTHFHLDIASRNNGATYCK